jgi:phosphoglycerol transferase MdoB-like AlkP superfamily enzyme
MGVTGGHLDIAPTLLGLVGITADNAVMLGRDLSSGADSLVVFRDGSFTDGKHYYLNRFGPASNSTCYTLPLDQPVDCTDLERSHRTALERLEISDLIIRGNLIPALLGEE